MTHRDITPTVIPAAPDHEIGLYERIAAQHPDQSVMLKFRRALDRIEIVRARLELRNWHSDRGCAVAATARELKYLPAVVRGFTANGDAVVGLP